MRTPDGRTDVRLIPPAQSHRYVYGLRRNPCVSTNINSCLTLMAMDAPEVMPAGSHESFESFVLPGSSVAMESTVWRGQPYQIHTFPFFKEL